MPSRPRRPKPITKKCDWCNKKFTLKLCASKRTRYCFPKCNRRAQHNNKLELNRERNRKWYQLHREEEIKKNREYRNQNRELFNWYHNRDRFNGLKYTVLERNKNQCIICGSKNKLVVHHIDGTNYKLGNANNTLENLMTVCESCHHEIHWWQKANYNLKSSEDIVRTIRKRIEASRNVSLPRKRSNKNA